MLPLKGSTHRNPHVPIQKPEPVYFLLVYSSLISSWVSAELYSLN